MVDNSTPISPGGSHGSGRPQVSRRLLGNDNRSESHSGGVTEQSTGEATNRSDSSVQDLQSLEETAERLNQTAEALNKDIRFNVVPSENVIQAEIFNRKTDEVIKQIPPDEMIELQKRIDAFVGLFFDEFR